MNQLCIFCPGCGAKLTLRHPLISEVIVNCSCGYSSNFGGKVSEFEDRNSDLTSSYTKDSRSKPQDIA